MNIVEETIRRITISHVPDLDPIRVALEDIEPGKGRINIECWGTSWANYWGGMGDQTIAEFFSTCSVQYLAGKLSSIDSQVFDPDKLEETLKREVIEERKKRLINNDEARKRFDAIEDLDLPEHGAGSAESCAGRCGVKAPAAWPNPPAKKPTRPVIRYHGGKWRLAAWLISHFPPHLVYVEPFGGAASVLLQKERAYSEVYNDLDGEVVNMFRVLQCPVKRARLIEMLRFTPYAREEFKLAWEPSSDQVESARRLMIRAQMGFGSAGATKASSGFRIDTGRRYSTAMMDWVRYPDVLPPIIERMTGVILENRPALAVIANNDTPETLFYIDPPYMHDTRVMDGSTRYYRHEMTDSDHAFLIAQLLNCKGMVVLNGYENDLYNAQLFGWQKFTKESRISAHRGTKIKHEIIWINPACSDALERHREEIAA